MKEQASRPSPSSSDPIVERNFRRAQYRNTPQLGRVLRAGLESLGLDRRTAPGEWGMVDEIENSEAYKNPAPQANVSTKS